MLAIVARATDAQTTYQRSCFSVIRLCVVEPLAQIALRAVHDAHEAKEVIGTGHDLAVATQEPGVQFLNSLRVPRS